VGVERETVLVGAIDINSSSGDAFRARSVVALRRLYCNMHRPRKVAPTRSIVPLPLNSVKEEAAGPNPVRAGNRTESVCGRCGHRHL
jgi:hypothetical protein